MSPAAADHPDHAAIRDLLRTYFQSINRRDYKIWSKTVTGKKQQEQPRAKWHSDYRSTHDSNVKVHRIAPGPKESLRVLMSFTSTQDPSDAPESMPMTCLRWRVVYQVVPVEGEFRLGEGLPESSLHQPC